MDTLPAEITENIYYYIPTTSLYVCTWVCRRWNSEFTPVLYSTVAIDSFESYTRFKRTVTSPHSTANRHVQHVRFILDSATDISGLATHLPNVKTIKAFFSAYKCEENVDEATQNKTLNEPITNISQLKYLRHISYAPESIYCLSMVLQNEHSLNSSVIDYLKQFRTLHGLNINFKQTPVAPTELFMEILQQCPSVTILNYGPEIDIDYFFVNKPRMYPDMRDLHLHVPYLTLPRVVNIKSTFANLHHLVFVSTVYDELLLAEFFSPSDTFSRVTLDIHSISLGDLRKVVSDKSTITRIEIEYSPRRYETNSLSFRYGGVRRGCRKYTLNINGDHFPNLCLSDLSNIHRDKIQSVDIQDSPTPVDINRINALFPSLVVLSISGKFNIQSSSLSQPNNDMYGLNLDLQYLNQQVINALQLMYPNVRRLCLNYGGNFLSDLDFEDGVCILKLPWNDLPNFHLFEDGRPSSPKCADFKMLLRWKGIMESYYAYQRIDWEYTPHITESTLASYIQDLKQPLIIFETKCDKWMDMNKWFSIAQPNGV